MDELRHNAKSLLERARPDFSPSAQEVQALRARLTLGPVPPDGGGGSGGAANWGTYLGIAVVVALIGGGAALVATRDRAPVTASVEPSLPASIPRLKSPPVAASAEEPVPVTPSPAPQTVAPPRARKAAPPPSAEKPRDRFNEELELITRSRRALKGRDFATARKAAAAYLERFPRGSFREEAEVLRLVARCRSGRDATTADRARAYASGKDNAFARRVRKACLDSDP